MKFIKKNLKYIILILVCIAVSIGYSYYNNKSHKSAVKTNITNADVTDKENMGDVPNQYVCLTNYSSYDTRLTAVSNNYINDIYPVGSIYMSVSSTNPSSLFGGTWVAFGAGKTLVGIDTGNTSFDTVEETGGAKTRTLSVANLPSHTHEYQTATATGSYTLTTDDIPSHSHTLEGLRVYDNGTGSSYMQLEANSQLKLYKRDGTLLWNSTGTYSSTNSGFKTVVFGKSYTTTDTMTTGGSAHSHSITTTATASGSYGQESPTEISVQDPYITVYMWKRTA